MQARVDRILIILETQVITKNGRFGPYFQTIFPFFMTMAQSANSFYIFGPTFVSASSEIEFKKRIIIIVTMRSIIIFDFHFDYG